MSSTRQNNLFAAEDWKVIYDAFTNVSLKAYDYNSIYNALVEYLRINNPDEFNDYVAHSEMLAHINMLAYLGQSLAFRIDLNARENFFDTAERRESILDLAYALSYNSSRNKTANGLVKIVSLITTQPIMDSQGNSLAGREVVWNQVNDDNWYDNFIRILNSSLDAINKFGTPVKQENIDGINTELYSINSLTGNGWQQSYPFSSVVNGKSYSFEVVSTNLDSGGYYESMPNPNDQFKLLYRNDNNGVSSPRTGFFLEFKEGQLQYQDFFYESPIPNRQEFIDVENINNTDVWVQEIDNDGNIIDEWVKVESLSSQNVIYNSIHSNVRKVYSVKTEQDNTIRIVFPDGFFGDVPTGNIRVWYRTSVNESYIIRPTDIRNKSKTIIYYGHDGQEYQLSVKFSLAEDVANAEPEESKESIAKNAPLLYYTQDRMVNGEDYNIFPLTRTNQVKKLKTVNRTYAGHSRYVDVSDPTGSLSNLNIVGDDGIIFKEDSYIFDSEVIDYNTNFNSMIYQRIEKSIQDCYFKLFYYDTFRKTLLSNPTLNKGGLGNDFWSFPTGRYVWKTLPNKVEATTGYIFDTVLQVPVSIGDISNERMLKYLRKGSTIKLVDSDSNNNDIWINIKEVTNNGIVDLSYMTTGTVTLSQAVKNDWILKEVVPSIRTKINDQEAALIEAELAGNRSFGLRYDYENELWKIIPQDNILNTDNTFDLNELDTPSSLDNRWLLKVNVLNDTDTITYEFLTRGIRYVFGSNSTVQFNFKNTTPIIDPNSGRLTQDYIEVLESNSDRINSTETTLQGRAIVGQFRTKANHNINTDYNITVIIGTDSDYSNIKFYDLDNNELSHHIIPLPDNEYKVRFTGASPNMIIRVSDIVEMYNSTTATSKLKRSYKFAVVDGYINSTGKSDFTKVAIVPFDENFDGIYDYPLSFDDIVSPQEIVILRTSTTFDGMTFEVVDNSVLRISQIGGEFEPNKIYFADDTITINDIDGSPIVYQYGDFYVGVESNGVSLNRGEIIESNQGSSYRYVYGRTFTDTEPFMFRWKHYADPDQRIDPSISNVMACYVLTNDYDEAMRIWVRRSGRIEDMPKTPTTNAIRSQLRRIEPNKMYSDQMIYIPSNYKLLFGRSALPQHQASFKVIKTIGTIITDNEIKSRIVAAINEFFNIENWDFGDGFYFSELSTFIHSKLIGIISSIVLVPKFENSSFGDLFEITAEPNELFLSTASVEDIEIVRTYNDYNLRKQR